MISAIILAAGESKRMGQPKLLLTWGNATVLGQVISTYQSAGIEDVLVVTGGAHDQVSGIVNQHGARSIFNENFSTGGMLSSLQRGLQLLLTEEDTVEASLVGLGDQPQVQTGSVQLICRTFQDTGASLIVPSFQMRRGHPWLVKRLFWSEILEMRSSQSPRDFLNKHASEIHYVEVSTSSILADLDTPQDYQRSRP
ncbi:MAG TPA: nucleotidyltransferase family protein [Anaerolineales bacterium]|nr:nucleotidyltransferase family protein [Anaerolineales bacterium]